MKGIFSINPDMYGTITRSVYTELKGFLPAACIVIRLSLDSRAPILCSPLKKSISWEDFHPGYRLINILAAAKCVINSLNLKFDKFPEHMYWHTLLEEVFLRTNNIIKEYLGYDMWDEPENLVYKVDLPSLADRMTEESKNDASILFKGSPSFVLHHLFNSFAGFRERRSFIPVEVFAGLSTRLAEQNESGGIIQTYPQKHFATFSIFHKQIGSIYMPSDPDLFIGAITLFLRNMVLNRLLKGEKAEDIMKHIDENYSFFDDCDLDILYKSKIFSAMSSVFRVNFAYKPSN